MTTITPVNIDSQMQNTDFKGSRKTKLVSVSQGEGYEKRVYETEASTGKNGESVLRHILFPG